MSSPSFEILVPASEESDAGVKAALSAGTNSWWLSYVSRLATLTKSAVGSLESDSRRIAHAAMPLGSGDVRHAAWPASRVRTGVVVGSVQSGKTANMLGVCAHLLDAGVDIVVLLAGTRVALWLQTFERMLSLLDGSTPSSAWRRDGLRVLVPAPQDIINELGRLRAKEYLSGRRFAASQGLRKGLPLLIVVPKEDDHLLELSKFLASICSGEHLESTSQGTHLVVLDDEADDASILEASDSLRVTPKYIQMLWSDRASGDATRHPNLYATYVAYTATPQANFLQRTHNPLAPRHFRVALRTPLDNGGAGKTTFNEPSGVRSFYCGGEIFYERFRGTPVDFCVTDAPVVQMKGEDDLAFQARFGAARHGLLSDALRSFFVAGALRLLQARKSLSALEGAVPLPLAEMASRLPPTHSMLFHPSALKQDQFEGASEICRWSAEALDGESADKLLSADGLRARVVSEEDLWRRWVERFRATSQTFNLLPGARFELPDIGRWDEVKEILFNEVFPHTKIRILNSDPRADDRPRFDPLPSPGDSSLFLPPPDLFTIFVAGNVLSRGLTVNGLCTSLFLRVANEPAQDTQMQMQRWFGYRGSHLPFCKLFMFEDQLNLFRHYHANDEALKAEIIRSKSGAAASADEALVLQGTQFRATNKIDSRRIPLHPGPTPSIKLIEARDPDVAASNLGILRGLVTANHWDTLEQPVGVSRGLVGRFTLSLEEVAKLLEGFRFSDHRPGPAEELHRRWGLMQGLLAQSEPFFRPPAAARSQTFSDPSGCPYSIAAYLRLWLAALQTREAPGLFPTDAPRMPWNMIDLPAYNSAAPRFFVGIRFGERELSIDPVLGSAGVRVVTRGLASPDSVKTLWGTRGTSGTYLGDQMFDYHVHQAKPTPRLHEDVLWRPRGHPGLLLFYVAHTPLGEQPLVGLAIPHGGPDHIAALRASASPV